MHKKTVVLSVITTISLLTISLTGCDLIGLGPKKEIKKTAPKEIATPTQPQEIVKQPLTKDELARVGDWTLTVKEFNERLKLLKQGLPDFDDNDPNSKNMVLDELIRQQLLVKDAEQSDIGNQKDIKDAVEDFRKTLLVQELANRLTKDIVANDAEAQKYYDENKALFVDPIAWKAREIVVADEAAAKAALVLILQGADFAQTAQAQSKGKTAATGGELPEFTKAPFDAMQAAIANLDAGATSAVFKGPEGYYIVKVEAKQGGTPKAFSEVKKELVTGLTLRKQQEAVLNHLNKLAEKEKVEVNKELLEESSVKK